MNNSKNHVLTGTHNQRINKTSQTDHESTAAWAGADHHEAKSNVTVPGINNVLNAKDWVDNGSRL